MARDCHIARNNRYYLWICRTMDKVKIAITDDMTAEQL